MLFLFADVNLFLKLRRFTLQIFHVFVSENVILLSIQTSKFTLKYLNHFRVFTGAFVAGLQLQRTVFLLSQGCGDRGLLREKADLNLSSSNSIFSKSSGR